MKTRRELKSIKLRKMNYAISQLLGVSPGYVVKKLERINVPSREEFLKRYKETEQFLTFSEEWSISDICASIKRTEEYQKLKEDLEKSESVKGKALFMNLEIVQKGQRIKENYSSSHHDEVSWHIYFHIIEDFAGVRGQLSVWYCHPLSNVWTKMKEARGARDVLKIGGDVIVSSKVKEGFRDKDITHIKRRHLYRELSKRIKKPLRLGKDDLGVYIQYETIKYHLGNYGQGTYYLNMLKRKKYSLTSELKEENERGQYFTNIIRKTIKQIQRQKDEYKRIEEEKAMKDKLFENLSRMYLDFDESLETGNCVPGTTQIYELAKKEVGADEDSPCAIRGDIVLDIVKKKAPHFTRNLEILASYTARNHYKHLFAVGQ